MLPLYPHSGARRLDGDDDDDNCDARESLLGRDLGGVYMTPGRLSRRGEFSPVPSHGSTFVYIIPPQKVMPARVAPGEFTPVVAPGRQR